MYFLKINFIKYFNNDHCKSIMMKKLLDDKSNWGGIEETCDRKGGGGEYDLGLITTVLHH